MGQVEAIMIKVSVALLAIWLLFICFPLYAAVGWTFDPPVTREDDTPLTNEEISHYEVYINGVRQPDDLGGTESSISLVGLENGEYCIVLRTVDTGGRVSRDSETSCKEETDGVVIIPPPPLDPDIPADEWTVLAYTSYEKDNWLMPPECAFDRGTPCTSQGDIWHSRYTPTEAQFPHAIAIDMGSIYQLTAFQQQPRSGGGNAVVKDYSFQVSMDGVGWTQVAGGTFPPGDQLHTIEFPTTKARYIQFVALSEQDGGNQASVDELYVLGTPVIVGARPLPPTVIE